METKENIAICRGCGRILIGKAYHLGGIAYIPSTERQKMVLLNGFLSGWTFR